MNEIVTEILTLTEDMKIALCDHDHDRADSLLTRRGVLLEKLSEIWPTEVSPPSDLVVALARVRELDAEIEETLTEHRDHAATEISRLAQRPSQTKKHGAQAPCILNRQA
jgi:hypothetical protein